jgi:transaldolase
MIPSRESLKVKLFADGADIDGMLEMANKPYISGLTTNPTLMRKAGVENYTEFAAKVLEKIQSKPISFEVFSDDLKEMKIQGQKISTWGENVYVKVPITTTQGESTNSVVKYLSNEGIKVNVTALMTEIQVEDISDALSPDVPSCVSVFAGRIADTGRDPMPIMKNCVDILSHNQNAELIWASPRELLNVFQANEVGCHIITATNDILKKLELVGHSLSAYSLDTVKMFYLDAQESKYHI